MIYDPTLKIAVFFILILLIAGNAFSWGNLTCGVFLEIRKVESEVQKEKLILIDQAANVFFIAGLTMGRNKHITLGQPFLETKSAMENQRLFLIEN